MEDTNSFQNLYRGDSKLSIELRNEMDIIANRLIDEFMQRMKNKLDKVWEIAILHEERLNANKRHNSRSVKTSEVTSNPGASPTFSSLETTTPSATNTTSNLIYNATTTGTISTILPFNPSYNINNNNDYNNNTHNYQPIIYEEEPFYSDGNYLSIEDYDFVDTIQSPTFSGISLPSLFYDSLKYSTKPIPTSSDVYNSTSVSSGLTITTHSFFSCQPISGVSESHMVAEYNFKIVDF